MLEGRRAEKRIRRQQGGRKVTFQAVIQEYSTVGLNNVPQGVKVVSIGKILDMIRKFIIKKLEKKNLE